MKEKELREFLKDHLYITIKDTVEFGPMRRVEINLELDNEVIASDYVEFDLK
jgi:hypothetical protein